MIRNAEMSVRFGLLMLGLFLPLAVGCSRVKHVYYVDPNLTLERKTKYHIFQDSLYFTPSQAEQIADKTLLVEVLDPDQTILGRKKGGRNLQRFARDFEKVLSDQLWRTEVFKDVATPRDDRKLHHPDLKLNVAITEWHEGWALLRWAIRAIGKTRVQIEGKFIDPETGQVYAAFADARIHPGHGLIAPRTWVGQALIAEDLAKFVKEFQKQVLAMTNRPVPEAGLQTRVPKPRPYRESADAGEPVPKLDEPTYVPKVNLQDIVR